MERCVSELHESDTGLLKGYNAKMRKHILILFVLWGLLSTIAVIYLWSSNQKLERTNKILVESNEVLKKLVANEYESYQAINDCFVVQKGLCDPEDFKNRLQVLGDEADGLYDQQSVFKQQLQRLGVLNEKP